MKITKQLFDKLSKKSQTEYKSKIDKIREINPPMIWINYTWGFIYFGMYMMILLPLWKIAFGFESAKVLFWLLPLGVRIFGLLFAIGLGIDLAILMIRINKLNKVREEYFKIVPKDEKRN